MADQCKEIEKCLKDMLFKNTNYKELLSSDASITESERKVLLDSNCLVSNIEQNAHSSKDIIGAFSNPQNQSSDLINLKSFVANHSKEQDIMHSSMNPPQHKLQQMSQRSEISNENCDKQTNSISKLINDIHKLGDSIPLICGQPLIPFGYHSSDEEKFQNKRTKKKKKKKDKHEYSVPESSANARQRAYEKSQSNKKLGSIDEGPSTPDLKLKQHITSFPGKIYEIYFKKPLMFNCRACDFNTPSEDKLLKHCNSPLHKEHKEAVELNLHLSHLPDPLPKQLEAIMTLLTNHYRDYGLGPQAMTIRNEVISRVKKFVESNLPCCTVEPIGSTVTGFANNKASGLDFILKVSSDMNPADALTNTYEAMLKDAHFKDVYDDFKQKIPRIRFYDQETKIHGFIILHNEGSVNVQLARLLSIYMKLDERVPILATAFRTWANYCEIDKQDQGTLPSLCYAIMLVYFLQQIQPPVLPVLHEVEDFSDSQEFFDSYLSEEKWKSKNTENVAQLWVKCFYFYNFVYKTGEQGGEVVSICSSKLTTCKEKNWGTKFYAIEEPFSKRNLAYVIGNHPLFRYIQGCFLQAYRYFAYPRLENGDVIKVSVKGCSDPYRIGMYLEENMRNSTDSCMDKPENNDDSSEDETTESYDDTLEDHDPDLEVEDIVSTIINMNLDEEKSVDDVRASESTVVNDDSSRKRREDRIKQNHKDSFEWNIDSDRLNAKCFYKFYKRLFTSDKGLPRYCELCKGKGHTKANCPNEALPPIIHLPPMTKDFLKCIDEMCRKIRNENMPSTQEVNFRMTDMREIESYIKHVYKDAELSLFGSYCNGFGFKKSDMDFCLTFKNKGPPEDIEKTKKIIETVGVCLSEKQAICDVIAITSAKVPIVKFTHKPTGLEGDLSLYNTLAQHNTRMLYLYSQIDERAQILGYVLKHFAKILGICDASRGSLSSYGYVLMVIFFLQQRNPPVLPVLQELHTGNKPVNLIEGWNAWFYDDLKNLQKVWPDYGKNKETVGELWLGLLHFYVCEFKLEEYVISIRQKTLLKRFTKLWTVDRLITIEDPFDLNHNLGAGLSKKMNTYIMKAFIRARERFGQPISIERLENMKGYEMSYLFNPNVLSDGHSPPIDRCCRRCGKIGHVANKCPQGKMRKNGKSKSKERNARRAEELPANSMRRNNNSSGNNQRNNRHRNQREPVRSNEPRRILSQSALPGEETGVKPEKIMMHSTIPVQRFPIPPRISAPSGFPGSFPVHFQNMNQTFSGMRPHMTAFSNSIQSERVNSAYAASPPKQYHAPMKHYSSSPPKPYGSPTKNFAAPTMPINARAPVTLPYPPPQPQTVAMDRRHVNMAMQQPMTQAFDPKLLRTNPGGNYHNSCHPQRW